uniref:Coiled-coil domain-containing protein n=1 Tax=Anoplophora glabripennis TaxID=217634 RepID=V5GGF6_ANOGL
MNQSRRKKKLVDPLFQQQPNESDRTFLFRVNKICENVRREAAFADKYGVEIKRDAAGEVKVVKREKDELELLIKKVKKEKAKKKTKKKNVESDSPKLTKSQKWEKKKKEKKLQKRLKSADEFEPVKDTVKFGEIAHAPPTLTLPKKVGKVTPRPGGKKLLLSAIVLKSAEESKRQPVKEKEKLQKVTKKTIDKKGKRKDLPNAVRRQLDTQQKEVIGAYKRLKAKKRSDS